MKIEKIRGRWCVSTLSGVKRFDTEEAALKFTGTFVDTIPIPVPEVREYATLEEALQGEDDLDLYEEELIAEED